MNLEPRACWVRRDRQETREHLEQPAHLEHPEQPEQLARLVPQARQADPEVREPLVLSELQELPAQARRVQPGCKVIKATSVRLELRA